MMNNGSESFLFVFFSKNIHIVVLDETTGKKDNAILDI